MPSVDGILKPVHLMVYNNGSAAVSTSAAVCELLDMLILCMLLLHVMWLLLHVVVLLLWLVMLPQVMLILLFLPPVVYCFFVGALNTHNIS